MAREYPDPWVPRTFSTWIVKASTFQRTSDRSTGQVRRRRLDCWDVKGKADGVQWLKRFRKAALAQAWKERLDHDFAKGLPFDLRAKQFVVPEQPDTPRQLTVFDLTELYFRQHPEWEPATKTAAARSFNRARRWLLVPGAEPEERDSEAVADYLESASFLPDRLAANITDRQLAGRAWLEAHSAPADSLTSAQVEEFVARFERSRRDPRKRVSPATMTRFLQPLKGCWTWAVSRDDIPIGHSPWVVVRPRRKVKGRTTVLAGRAGLTVDAEMVLSVPQSLELAKACATEGAWGGSSSVLCSLWLCAGCAGVRRPVCCGMTSSFRPVTSRGGSSYVARTDPPRTAGWIPTKTQSGDRSRTGT